MEIPLFPLPKLVLFPHVAVPLHIFEERYKLMIDRCLKQADVFGLVLLRDGAETESESTIHSVGVTARVVEVERLEDGRMNILAAGESRFRILDFTGRVPYWTGSVDLFDDVEESAEMLQEPFEEVNRLYRRAMELTALLKGSDPAEIGELPRAPMQLSYMVSYVLDIEPARKQQLLEITSTRERLDLLVIDLEQAIAELERHLVRQNLASKARGNGDLGKPH